MSALFRSPALYKENGRTFFASCECNKIVYRVGDCVSLLLDGEETFARIVQMFEEHDNKIGAFQLFIKPSPTRTNAPEREKQLYATERVEYVPMGAVIRRVVVLSFQQYAFGLHQPRLTPTSSEDVYYYRMSYDPDSHSLVDMFPEADEITVSSSASSDESSVSENQSLVPPSATPLNTSLLSVNLSHFSSHGVSVPVGPAALQLQLPVKRRRGRPRKVPEPASEPATIPVFTSLVSDMRDHPDSAPSVPEPAAAPETRTSSRRVAARRKKVVSKVEEPIVKETRKRKTAPASYSRDRATQKRNKLNDDSTSSLGRDLDADQLPTLKIDVSLSGSSWRLAAIKQELEESTGPTEDERTPTPCVDAGLASSDDDTDEEIMSSPPMMPESVEDKFALTDDFASPFDSVGLMNCSFASDSTCLDVQSENNYMPPLFEELF
eukprot:TRINITY_DN236_c0_g1_i2.p1 TRINITY_DN236_c0_g1~~TRINITY_DN236_c0_g1_i2.p1  ORF type:complete len:482 (-),score=86.67 TRINITY_DN236_c0_g1_i2:976-2286(-)